MPRTPTLENPFASEKHRSSDDPKFVGKILGPKAEAAMRKGMEDTGGKKSELKADIMLTDVERSQIKEEREGVEAREHARRELLFFAGEIGKDEKWVKETFIIKPDGTIVTKYHLILSGIPDCNRLPRGLVAVNGTFDLSYTTIRSLDHFPKTVQGDIVLHGTPITSLKGLPEEINGDLYLGYTSITALEGLPSPEKISGAVHVTDETLLQKLKSSGYKTVGIE